MKEIKNQLYMLYGEFEYIRDTLNIADLDQFDSIWLQKEEGNYSNALKLLTSFLKKYYDKKVVVLIDEYDTPIISAYGERYYKEAISFFKEFYGSVLKDNEYLELGVLTGILQVAKEGIFSGLNNITIHNILENRYALYFGFVQEEVENALIEFELKDKIEDVKTWYDGYRFGKTEVYNPWSILYYLYEKELGAYWVNTSSNDLIKQLLKQSGNEVFEELKALFSGGTIEKSINKYFNFNKMSNLRGLWELFVFSGYLKLEKKVNPEPTDSFYLLKIPNLEVKTFFRDSFIDNFLDGNELE